MSYVSNHDHINFQTFLNLKTFTTFYYLTNNSDLQAINSIKLYQVIINL